MEIKAYSARAWRISTRRTTGVWPITSPPLSPIDRPLDKLLEAEVIYIRLHGLGDQPYLYGDPGLPTALSAEQVRRTELAGQAIFLEGCYIAQIADAFMAAGAKTVVGNRGITWGRRFFLGPAQIVGRAWLRTFKITRSPKQALRSALNEVTDKWGAQFSQGWEILDRSEA